MEAPRRPPNSGAALTPTLPPGLLAKRAVQRGLRVQPYIKTSLSPGSGVVTCYLQESGVMAYLAQLG